MEQFFEEAEKQIEALYSTSNQEQVTHLSKNLRDLQRSEHGQALASYLLQSQSVNSRYFGALSYAVVIQHLDQPSDEQLNELIQAIGTHIHQNVKVSMGQNLIVLRKLASDLSQIFIRFPNNTRNPLATFIQAISGNTFDDSLSFASCIANLSADLFILLLLFFAIFVEDVTRLNDYRSAVHSVIKSDIYPLLVTCVDYVKHLLSQRNLSHEIDLETSKTIASWMTYVPNIGGELRYSAEEVAPITEYLMIHLDGDCDTDNESNLQLCKECMAVFSEILESDAALLSMETKSALYSNLFDEGKWGHNFLNQIVFTNRREEFDEEVNAYVYLAIVIAQLNSIRLSKTILEPKTRNVLSILYRLTAIPGVPHIDESISEQTLVFWEEFANIYVDSEDLVEILLENNDDPSFADAFNDERKRIFDEVSKIYWTKIQIPKASDYYSSKADFLSYRSNVADFFLVVYNLLKAPFYEGLTNFIAGKAESNFSEEHIAELESTLFLLYKINDDSSYYESQTRALIPCSQRIFNSNIIRSFQSLPSSLDLTVVYTSTFLQYLNSNEFYFASDEGFNHLGEPVVLEMLKNPEIDSLVRSRMFNAFSVIARSITDLEEHARIINGLITTIADAARSMIGAASEELNEGQEEYLISLISCIVNIAKGSGLPDETIDNMSEEFQARFKEFWISDPLQTKQVVLLIVEELSMNYPPLRQKTIVIEKATQVFKAGLGEKLNGPLTFSNETIAEYAIKVINTLENPNAVPYVFALIESLICFNFRELEPALVQQLVDRLVSDRLSFLKTDPDMMKSAIDLSAKIIECKPSLIIHTDAFVNIILHFALDGLSANETFIVKSVSKFWTNFTSLKKGTKEDQDRINDIFLQQNLGEVLTKKLLQAFLKAPRSSLDGYYMIFRAIIGKFTMQFKQWLVNALREPETTAGSKATEKDLEMFVHRLVVTRGRRAANEVLKSFWLLVNGFVEYNTQSF
ncbi:hypothetical protein CXQ85_001650 [Candidozyma haemuli]|uniref:Importin N-terminal domain-containing protein n=1 Tax=Candidozyma haemuli TaxID=45357 RepID=A0A2V1AQ15_9ASCO|nr:hypothetical protein CXQ85_001650 [[Candida] haemuloni]PVH19875.1 hypothetical protein CXQ85_001650 [[Candida] haemuloni]